MTPWATLATLVCSGDFFVYTHSYFEENFVPLWLNKNKDYQNERLSSTTSETT